MYIGMVNIYLGLYYFCYFGMAKILHISRR